MLSRSAVCIGLTLVAVTQAQNITHPRSGDTQRIVNGQEAPEGRVSLKYHSTQS